MKLNLWFYRILKDRGVQIYVQLMELVHDLDITIKQEKRGFHPPHLVLMQSTGYVHRPNIRVCVSM